MWLYLPKNLLRLKHVSDWIHKGTFDISTCPQTHDFQAPMVVLDELQAKPKDTHKES